jgi:pantoate--beta-alanine ligase
MQVYRTIEALRMALASYRKQRSSIGFVPTMGALHQGHLSLVRKCLLSDSVSVVSIYVNPSQFNDINDLKNYPRNPVSDLGMLDAIGCHIVFMPDDNEMYPEPDTRKFDLGEIGNIMEGKHRPGHFNGVAQIVTKLFDAVQPDRAYFGQKDFQQLAIIRKIVADMHYPIEIIACPIIRETDGLAMSSRNQLLTPEQRKAAPIIFQALKMAKEMAGYANISQIKSHVNTLINRNPHLQLEYFELVESRTLAPLPDLQLKNAVTACIAVKAGMIRLIDNIDFIL